MLPPLAIPLGAAVLFSRHGGTDYMSSMLTEGDTAQSSRTLDVPEVLHSCHLLL